MTTKFLTSLVFIILIIIFIIWSFALNKTTEDEQIKEGFLYILKQAGEEVKQAINVFKKETNKEINQNVINNIIDEGSQSIKDKNVIHRLKEKILKYDSKTQKTTK